MSHITSRTKVPVEVGSFLAPRLRNFRQVLLVVRPHQLILRLIGISFFSVAAVIWITSCAWLQALEYLNRQMGFRPVRSSAGFQMAFGVLIFVPMALAYGIGTRLSEFGSNS